MFKDRSRRISKLSRNIKELIRMCLYKGKNLDKRLYSCPITITKVLLSGDKSFIRCFFIGFNTCLVPVELLKILNDSKAYIRYYLAQKLQFKYSPVIEFYYDEGFFNLDDVEQALQKDQLIDKRH